MVLTSWSCFLQRIYFQRFRVGGRWPCENESANLRIPRHLLKLQSGRSSSPRSNSSKTAGHSEMSTDSRAAYLSHIGSTLSVIIGDSQLAQIIKSVAHQALYDDGMSSGLTAIAVVFIKSHQHNNSSRLL